MSGGGNLSDLAFSTEDRLNTGRPIRIRLAAYSTNTWTVIPPTLGQ